MKKIRVGILFGGKSAEHEVSVQSAKNVVHALDRDKYEILLIGISKKGTWHTLSEVQFEALLANPTEKLPQIPEAIESVPSQILDIGDEKIDVLFPVLHGPMGEDGSIQGMLKIMDIPFVGADILGSAIGMDKDVTKRLLREAGLPVARFTVFNSSQKDNIIFSELEEEFGLPFFIKPANLGSSIGVSKVANEKQFQEAVTHAFSYDTKILIEEYIHGRELECSVLGNHFPIASTVGEIIVKSEFYSYDAKYIEEKGAVTKIPAAISDEIEKKIQDLSIQAFEVLCVSGMARVDFFLSSENLIYINEINTIPGFTNISMYPKLWEESGLTKSELLDRLIQLAIERFTEQHHLKTSIT